MIWLRVPVCLPLSRIETVQLPMTNSKICSPQILLDITAGSLIKTPAFDVTKAMYAAGVNHGRICGLQKRYPLTYTGD